VRAVVITQPGGPEYLEVREAEQPVPGPRQVLVRVHASALNRADVLQRTGRYPAPNDAPRSIPGIEFAGVVDATGPGATRWQAGERVFGIIGGGGHAEYLVAHEATLAAIPERLDWIGAAAVPEAFITAHDALVTQAGLQAGETVLVLATGSGVGLAAVQVARAWEAVPYGTSRTPDKIERARALGLADGAVVDGSDPQALTAAVAGWTAQRGVDVVLDLLGGPYFPACVEALAVKGRLMMVGAVAGAQSTIDVRRVLGKRLTLRGTVLRARALDEKIAVAEAFSREVVPRLASGELRPVVDSIFPLSRIGDAHRRMESNATFGKVVIDVDSRG
jgi:putative PIG3 family NAD(P)H quinone oxidoreductase